MLHIQKFGKHTVCQLRCENLQIGHRTDGIPHAEILALTKIEAELGAYHLTEGRGDPLFRAYIEEHLSSVRRRVTGLRVGGGGDPAEEELLRQMEGCL